MDATDWHRILVSWLDACREAVHDAGLGADCCRAGLQSARGALVVIGLGILRHGAVKGGASPRRAFCAVLETAF
jgi:hypothetical protein